MQVWFFYGTLLDDQVFKAVTGRDLACYRPRQATALSVARVFLPGQSYPTLIGRSGSQTSGLVCQGLPPSVLRRLVANLRCSLLTITGGEGMELRDMGRAGPCAYTQTDSCSRAALNSVRLYWLKG